MNFHNTEEPNPFTQDYIKYFVEHAETRLWLSLDSLQGYDSKHFPFVTSLPIREALYTNDPLKAVSFDSLLTASGWAYENGIRETHLITEHEFVNIKP